MTSSCIWQIQRHGGRRKKERSVCISASLHPFFCYVLLFLFPFLWRPDLASILAADLYCVAKWEAERLRCNRKRRRPPPRTPPNCMFEEEIFAEDLNWSISPSAFSSFSSLACCCSFSAPQRGRRRVQKWGGVIFLLLLPPCQNYCFLLIYMGALRFDFASPSCSCSHTLATTPVFALLFLEMGAEMRFVFWMICKHAGEGFKGSKWGAG